MTEKQIRRITKLGITGFEKTGVIERRHADMLERLKSNGWFHHLRGPLQRCTADRCGKTRCVEVCEFADWRRRLQQLPDAHRLIRQADGPVYEVRVVRGIWARSIGDLRDASIAAAKQLNRRALDSIFIPTLVAVGTFKVSLGPKRPEPYWVCEVHQIVAGASKEDLEKAFTDKWAKEKYDSVVRVTKVEELGQTLSNVFRADLQGWQNPYWLDGAPVQPKRRHREEFYRWVLSLSFGERLIRYGCDRYLNQLKKKPRVIRPKVHKRRRYPTWLIPHMFGNRGQPGEYPDRRDRRYR